MDFKVSPGKDLSFLVSRAEIKKLEKHRRSRCYREHALTFVDDTEEDKGAILGCSQSEMFRNTPSYNGFQVEPPGQNDNIYMVNVEPGIVRILMKRGEYKAVYNPKTEATLEIRRQG
jgi:hypothetical protein